MGLFTIEADTPGEDGFAVPEAGFGEAVKAGFNIAKPRAGFAPKRRLEAEIYSDVDKFMDGLLPQLGRNADTRLSGGLMDRLIAQRYRPDEQTLTDMLAELDQRGVEYPDEIKPENFFARRLGIIGKIQERDAENEAVLARAGPVSGPAGGFVGGVGAEFTDPGNLATLAIGAPVRAGLLSFMAIEAGVNAAIEGLQTPGRNAFLAEIGAEPESLGRNMATGAVFGAAFGGTIRGVQIGIGAYRDAGQVVGPGTTKTIAAAARQSDDPELRILAEKVTDDIRAADAAVTNPAPDTLAEYGSRSGSAEMLISGQSDVTLPTRPATLRAAPSIINGTLEETSPRDLLVQPEIFQFKSETIAPGGVTAKLADVTEWDDTKAGTVVVFEYGDGRQAIADGHQRVALANRIMAADPSQDIKLAANVYREADGFTPDDAMVIGAAKNLAESADGLTSRMAVDAARVLRVKPEFLNQLPSGAGIRATRELVALSDDAFALVINDVIPSRYGAAIGRMVDDPAMHMPMARLIERLDPDTLEQVENVISQALETPVAREKVTDLFGDRDVVESLYLERAKVLERSMKILRADRQLFATLTDSADRIEGAGANRLDARTNEQIKQDTDAALAAVKALAHRAGPISEALNDGAKALKEGGRIKAAAEKVADIIRREVQRNGLAGANPRVAGRAAKPAGQVEPTPVDPNVGFDDPTGQSAQDQIANTKIEAGDIDEAVDDLFGQVPVGRSVDEDGNVVATTVSRQELADELDADDAFADQLGACLT